MIILQIYYTTLGIKKQEQDYRNNVENENKVTYRKEQTNMNYFTKELKKICDRSEYIHDPKFVGRAAMFKLPDGITGKLEFVTQGYADHYSALRLTVMNRSEGKIDCQLVDLTELLGKKKMYSGTTNPHIWVDSGEPEWYGFTPTEQDYSAMAQTADDYLYFFKDMDMSEDESEALGIDLY